MFDIRAILRDQRLHFVAIAGGVLLVVWLATGNQRADQDRGQFRRSVQKAAPFIAAFQRGQLPTEDEIKAARIGPFEPVLLRQLRLRREIDTVYADYEQHWNALAVWDMLSPEQLISESTRGRSAAKLSEAASWNSDFEQRISAVIDQGMRDVLALVTAANYTDGEKGKAFTTETTRLREYLLGIAAFRAEYQTHVQQVLTLLNAHPKDFRLEGGEKPVLRFQDGAVAQQYDAKLDDIEALLRRGEAMDQAFNTARDAHRKKIGEALKSLGEGN